MGSGTSSWRSPLVLLLLLAWVGGLLSVPQTARAADAQVTLTKSVDPTTLVAGSNAVYSFQVACISLTVGCVNLTVTDFVPAGLTVTVPGDTATVDYTYDPATRTLTAKFMEPLPAPAGETGVPAGDTRTINLVVGLPANTPLLPPGPLVNTATAAGTNTNTATSSVNLTIDVPVLVNPVGTKSWSPDSALVQSAAASTMTLGVANSSSSTARVTALTMKDLPVGTFNSFDVTQVGPVVYPPGTDRVSVSVCTVPITVEGTCNAPLVNEGTFTGTGPFTLPTPLGNITGMVFSFSSSTAGAVLPVSSTQGTVSVGVKMRNTLRTDGSPILPTTPQTFSNQMLPAATDLGLGEVAGTATTPVTYTINPLVVLNIKSGPAAAPVLGSTANVVFDSSSYNRSSGSMFALRQQDPAPGESSVNVFQMLDVNRLSVTPPQGAVSTEVTVTCSNGSSKSLTLNVQFPNSVDVLTQGDTTVNNGAGPMCPNGVFPTGYTATAMSAPGTATITNLSTSRLLVRVFGPLSSKATLGTVITNCALTTATGSAGGLFGAVPVSSSRPCWSAPPVAPPTQSLGNASKTAGDVTTIVSGQPLDFTLTYQNTGNVSVNAVLQDPPDPLAADNPFKSIVKLAGVTAPGNTSIEVYDRASNRWVAYDPGNATLMANALGVRITTPTGANVVRTATVSVLLRDPQPVGTTFRNCATVGVQNQAPGEPFCSGTITVAEPVSSGEMVSKAFTSNVRTRPWPGRPLPSFNWTPMVMKVRNTGTLYMKDLVVTDTDPNFWKAYQAVPVFAPFVVYPPGANRADFQLCTTFADCAAGNFTVTSTVAKGNVVYGQPTFAAGVLESARGFRVRFYNSNGGYMIQPQTTFPDVGVVTACNGQSICIPVQPRPTLLGEDGQPTGTLIPDTTTNTATATGDTTQQTVSMGPAAADVSVVQGLPTLSMSKTPDVKIGPGMEAEFTLQVKNTGNALAQDPYIRDPLPSTLDFLADTFPGAPAGQPYAISYQVPAGMPTPTQVDFTADETTTGGTTRVSQLNWRFPGFQMVPDSTMTITYRVRLAPGVPEGTKITNTAGFTYQTAPSSSTAWCSPGTFVPGGGLGTPASPTAWCTASANVDVLGGTAFQTAKWSAGDPALGFLYTTDGTVVPTTSPVCPRRVVDGVTYTRFPCVARNKPGQGFTYLLEVGNLSNNAVATALRIVDTLPVSGDRGILIDQPRDTQWSSPPRLLSPVQQITNFGTLFQRYTTFNTAAQRICFDQVGSPPLPTGCTPASWTAQFPADRASITAFQSDLTYSGSGLLPGQTTLLKFQVGSPLTVANPSDTSAAWNSFAVQQQIRNTATQVESVLQPTETVKSGLAMVYGRVQVVKNVVGLPPGVVLPPFPMEYRCTATAVQQDGSQGPAQQVASGSLQVVPGTPAEIPGPLPAGAVCRVWETDSQGGVSGQYGEANAVSVTVEPTLTPEGQRAPQQVAITNDYTSIGTLVLSKTVQGTGVGLPLAGGGKWGDGPFTASVTCSFPGNDPLPGFPQTVTLTPGTPLRIGGVLIGSTCTVTETANQSATTTQVQVGTSPPVDGASATLTVVQGDNTVGFINTFTAGELQINKQLTGDAKQFAPRDYTFSVSCTVGQSLAFTPVPATVTLATAANSGSTTVGGLPLGGSCAVVETGNGGAASTTVTGSPATVVAGSAAVVTVANDFPAGQVKVVKRLAGNDAAAGQGRAYGFDVYCQRTVGGVTAVMPGWPKQASVTVAAGQTSAEAVLAYPLPVGASCWAVETESHGATSVDVDFGSADDAAPVVADTTAAITAVNTFDNGGLVIEKQVLGLGASFATKPFVFSLSCTANGQPLTVPPVTITPPDLSATVPGLPVGAVCSVAETDNGGADGAPLIQPAQVTVPAADAASAVVRVTNMFSAGTLELSKTVVSDGMDPALFTGPLAFKFEVSCQGSDGNLLPGWPQTVTLQATAGGPPASARVVGLLPVGARCWAQETDTQGATGTTVVPGSAAQATPVPASEGGQTLMTIAATNTYEPGRLTISKAVTGAAQQYAPRTYPFSVSCSAGGKDFAPISASLTLDAGLPTGSAAVGGLPVGASCAVAETDNGGATTTTVTDSPATIAAGSNPVVSVVNDFPAGSVSVAKEVTGAQAGAATGAQFTVRVFCQRPVGGTQTVFLDQSVTLTGGETKKLPDPLPYGASCWGQETGAGGATSSTVAPDSAGAALPVGKDSPDVTIKATNVFDEGTLVIDKQINGPGGPLPGQRFTFDVTCTLDGRALTVPPVTVTAPQLVSSPLPLPVGASCTVAERPPYGGADGPAALSPDGPYLVPPAAQGPVKVTARNTFSLGSLTIAKNVANSGLDPALIGGQDLTFRLEVTCQRPLPGGGYQTLPGYPQEVGLTVPAGQFPATGQSYGLNQTVDLAVPVGARCWAAETDAQGASTSTVDFGSTGSAAVMPPPGPDGTPAITITATNTYTGGQLRIDKQVTGDARRYAPRDFTFQVDCTAGNTVFAPVTASVTLPDGADAGSTGVTGLPVGASCTVAESGDGGATTTTITGLPADIAAGGAPVVTVTNDYPSGTLTVAKVLNGNNAVAGVGKDFAFDVYCQSKGGQVLLGWPKPVTVKAVLPPVAATVPVPGPVPYGASCWAVETGANDATATSIDHGSAAEAVGVTENEPSATITATNTFDTGGLDIVKVLTGDGAQFATGPFSFEVSCTRDGTALPPVPVTITPPVLSQPVPGLPVGAVCTVAETGTGGADGPPVIDPAQPVTVPAAGAPSQVVTVTNTFSAGRVDLTKTVVNDGVDLTLFGGPLRFGYEVTCRQAGADNPLPGYPKQVPVVLPADQLPAPGASAQATVTAGEGLPVGAACSAVETAADGATASSIDAGTAQDPVVVPGPVDGAIAPAVIRATNTYTPGTVQVTKTVTGPGAGFLPPDATFTVQVTCQRPADGGYAPLLTRAVDIKAGQTSTVSDQVPLGSRCWGVETATFGAQSSTVAPGTQDTAGVLTAKDPTLTIDATNTYQAGRIEVAKLVKGPGSGPFDLQVACTWNNPAARTPVALPGNGALRLDSGQSGGFDVPLPTTCTVTEPGAAGATVSYAASSGATDGTATATVAAPRAVVAVTNTFPDPGNPEEPDEPGKPAEPGDPGNRPTTTPNTGADLGPWPLAVLALALGALLILAARRKR